MIRPPYISSEKAKTDPKYKWDNALALRFYAARDQNPKLLETLEKSTYTAQTVIGIGTAEWILWRFEGYYELSDPWRRLEAAWAGLVTPADPHSLKFKLSKDLGENEKIKGPVEITLALLGELYSRYASRSVYIGGPVIRLITLARHILPNKKVFDAWLSDTLRRAQESFPKPVTADSQTFDPALEKLVVRDFLNPPHAFKI